jgi:Zn-dependent protease
VLYALEHPAAFVVLLASFVLGMSLRGWAQSLVADRAGDRRPRLEQRLTPDPRRHLDPFGAVAAALSGLGWSKAVELPERRSRAKVVLVALAGPLVNIALGVGVLLACRFAFDPVGLSQVYGFVGASQFLQHGLDLSGGYLQGSLLLLGASQLYLGVLALVPLPPLDGGRLMLALAPATQGWQKARYYLVEQNIGTVLVLVMLVIGNDPLLTHLLDVILKPVLRLLLGV